MFALYLDVNISLGRYKFAIIFAVLLNALPLNAKYSLFSKNKNDKSEKKNKEVK